MHPSVFVAGTGLITAIGSNRQECMSALQNGASGIGPITRLNTLHKGVLPVGEVKFSNEELAHALGVSPEWPRTALLSAWAVREALLDLEIPDLKDLRTGFFSANSVGGMDKTENFFSDYLKDHGKGRLRNVVHHECGSITELVADHFGIKDQVTTVSTACSSSANAIFCAARQIRLGTLDVAVAGGADALTKFTLNGFNTLMILDQHPCQPFDENRRGLNLGEGAGYLVLVSEKVAKSLSRQPYCRLTGYHNANDAHHQTASSPEGTGSFLAMQGALKMAGLQASDIGYINLHGTGTQNNDVSEGTAVTRLFAPSFPKVSSTKAFTGHTLAASGGVEAVFSACSVKEGFIYPNLRFETPMKELPFRPETSFSIDASLLHVLSNSFGFGGNCSSLVFSKV